MLELKLKSNQLVFTHLYAMVKMCRLFSDYERSATWKELEKVQKVDYVNTLAWISMWHRLSYRRKKEMQWRFLIDFSSLFFPRINWCEFGAKQMNINHFLVKPTMQTNSNMISAKAGWWIYRKINIIPLYDRKNKNWNLIWI